MNFNRILYSVLPKFESKIYAIGGSFDGICEWYDINNNKWTDIKGYSQYLPEDDFQSYALIIQK